MELEITQLIGIVSAVGGPVLGLVTLIWKISNKLSASITETKHIGLRLDALIKQMDDYNKNVLTRVERISLRLDDTGRVTSENKNEIIRIGTRVSDIKEGLHHRT